MSFHLRQGEKTREKNWGSERKREGEWEEEGWRVPGQLRWTASSDPLCGSDDGTGRGGRGKYLTPMTILLLISPHLDQELPLSFSAGKMQACNVPLPSIVHVWFHFCNSLLINILGLCLEK